MCRTSSNRYIERIMDHLLFFKQNHSEYLDLPKAFSKSVQPLIPKYIIVSLGKQKWIIQSRSNATTGGIQLYGHTLRKFLQHNDVSRGHVLQFVVANDDIYITDFSSAGLSKHVYYCDQVGGSRPRYLARAISDSENYQNIPSEFWGNLNCAVPDCVMMVTHLGEFSVQCWHYFDDYVFELTVYTPDGRLYKPQRIKKKYLLGHPDILFEDEYVPYSGDYQDLLSFDEDVRKVFVTEYEGEPSAAHSEKTNQSSNSFNKNIDKNVLSKRALHVPAPFVREHKLYGYAHAELNCRGYTAPMSLKTYGDLRLDEETQSVHVVIRGDWKEFLKATHSKTGENLKFTIVEKSTGDKMLATVRNSWVPEFESLLAEDRVYVLSNFGVGSLKPDTPFYLVDHKYKINFYKHTSVEVTDSFINPDKEFNFVDYEDLNNLKYRPLHNNICLIDVIGQVVSSDDMKIIRRENRELRVINCSIQNLRGQKMFCSLWDSRAIKLQQYIQEHGSNSKVVILLQLAKWSFWDNNPGVSNSLFGSRLYINDKLPPIQQFIESLDRNENDSDAKEVVQLSTKTVVTHPEDYYKKFEFKHIDEVLEVDKVKKAVNEEF